MAASDILPDAAPTNWVDRFAPAWLRPWLKLARLDRPTGVWLLLLPAWQGIALADAAARRQPNLALMALFFAGAVLMRSAGCAYNDIVDRDLDAKVARTAARPLASGQIGVRGAWALVIGCSLASVVILLFLNLCCLVLALGSLVLVAAYPFMKRITWWPQAWLGLTFNWGALMGFAAASGGVPLLGWMALARRSGWTIFAEDPFGHLGLAAGLLYAAGVFWTLGYDTIYAVQDLEDDALAGVKSSARRLGAAAPRAVLGFYAISIALIAATGVAGRLSLFFWPLAALYAATLLGQPLRLKLDDPAKALRLFQANTLAGVILFMAIDAGSLPANFG